MSSIRKYVYIILFLPIILLAQAKTIEVGIDEKLGEYIPMDAEFLESDSTKVKLGEIITKPTILALVYYHCPDICSPMLTELSSLVDKIQLEPLKDFQVVTVSFDDKETPSVARLWKKNYLFPIKRNFPESAWNFLTGDSVNIEKLTNSLGFYYKRSGENDFIHASTLVAISPDGKISRYLFGLKFNPFDVKLALIDAQRGKTNPTIAKVLQFCYSYDPEGRNYTFNFTKIVGMIMLVAVGIFFGFLTLKKRKNSKGVE